MRGSGLAAVAAMLAFVTTSAFAHPFTLDDYFRLEAVGQVAVAPDDRRLVFERQRLSAIVRSGTPANQFSPTSS